MGLGRYLGWWLRAVAMGLALVAVGWLVGATLGLWSPIAAFVVGGLGIFLAGGGWAASRIGPAGLGAGFIGFMATVGMALEGHRALVLKTVKLHDAPSVEAWPTGADAVHVPPPRLDAAAAVSKSWVTGTGKNRAQYEMEATPLLDAPGGPVVGFACRSAFERRHPEGGYLVRRALFELSDANPCHVPVDAALERLVGQGRAVAPGAAERIVRIFPSEQALRDGAELEKAIAVPLALLGFYALACLIFSKRGFLSSPEKGPDNERS